MSLLTQQKQNILKKYKCASPKTSDMDLFGFIHTTLISFARL